MDYLLSNLACAVSSMKDTKEVIKMDSYIVDHCDECTSYGDDWYVDGNGEMVSACWGCPFSSSYPDED